MKPIEQDIAFHQWLDEIENYGTRYERFLEEWDQGMTPERVLQWLHSAYTIGKEAK